MASAIAWTILRNLSFAASFAGGGMVASWVAGGDGGPVVGYVLTSF